MLTLYTCTKAHHACCPLRTSPIAFEAETEDLVGGEGVPDACGCAPANVVLASQSSSGAPTGWNGNRGREEIEGSSVALLAQIWISITSTTPSGKARVSMLKTL